MISGHIQNILERFIRFVLGIILHVELCIFLVIFSEIKLSWEFVVIDNMRVSFYLFKMWLLRCDIVFCHCFVCVSEWEKSIVRSFLCVKTVALFDWYLYKYLYFDFNVKPKQMLIVHLYTEIISLVITIVGITLFLLNYIWLKMNMVKIFCTHE